MRHRPTPARPPTHQRRLAPASLQAAHRRLRQTCGSRRASQRHQRQDGAHAARRPEAGGLRLLQSVASLPLQPSLPNPCREHPLLLSSSPPAHASAWPSTHHPRTPHPTVEIRTCCLPAHRVRIQVLAISPLLLVWLASRTSCEPLCGPAAGRRSGDAGSAPDARLAGALPSSHRLLALSLSSSTDGSRCACCRLLRRRYTAPATTATASRPATVPTTAHTQPGVPPPPLPLLVSARSCCAES